MASKLYMVMHVTQEWNGSLGAPAKNQIGAIWTGSTKHPEGDSSEHPELL